MLHDAICAHNPKCGVKAKTNLQYAVLAADPMSGFVKAVAQIYPDKKIASVKHKSVMKRFNEMRFAAGANRDYMEYAQHADDDVSACFNRLFDTKTKYCRDRRKEKYGGSVSLCDTPIQYFEFLFCRLEMGNAYFVQCDFAIVSRIQCSQCFSEFGVV